VKGIFSGAVITDSIAPVGGKLRRLAQLNRNGLPGRAGGLNLLQIDVKIMFGK
jgi:hypothetical protein